MALRRQHLHPWECSPAEARAIQEQLRHLVIAHDDLGELKRIAGIDVGFPKGGENARAAVVVLSFPGLQLLEQGLAEIPTGFPYLPGLLSFREVPAILAALDQLSVLPDLLLCDGQGLAHPRRFGLACHLGVLCDRPSLGVAKSRLIGHFDPLPPERGSWVPLLDKGEHIGAVVRTRTGVQPLFLSIGHRIGLETGIQLLLACAPRFRLPETSRLAHRLASGPRSGGGG